MNARLEWKIVGCWDVHRTELPRFTSSLFRMARLV